MRPDQPVATCTFEEYRHDPDTDRDRPSRHRGFARQDSKKYLPSLRGGLCDRELQRLGVAAPVGGRRRGRQRRCCRGSRVRCSKRHDGCRPCHRTRRDADRRTVVVGPDRCARHMRDRSSNADSTGRCRRPLAAGHRGGSAVRTRAAVRIGAGRWRSGISVRRRYRAARPVGRGVVGLCPRHRDGHR